MLDIHPNSIFAGFSLGEYSALAASGFLDTISALRLVRKRGLAMSKAAKSIPGGIYFASIL